MKRTSKAFTLIELLIVISILAITLTLTSDILISLVRSNNKTRVKNELEQQSNFVALKIEKELRNAGNVDSSTGDSQLKFTLEDSTEITYFLAGNVLNRTVGGATNPVTSAHEPGGVFVSCSGDCFVLHGESPQRVDISLIFTPASSEGPLGTSFSGQVEVNTTVVLRNTY